MLRPTKFALPVALLVAATVSVCASSALAGAKQTVAYDPTAHTTAAGNVIHVYSFRWLTVARTTGFGTTSIIDKGTLKHTCAGWWHHHLTVCSTPVTYKLAHPRSCRGVPFPVWGRLYVKASGQTAWHELWHYGDVVAVDCA